MSLIQLSRIRVALASVAVLLCLGDAATHWLATLGFSEPDGFRAWMAGLLPTAFWLPAVTSVRYPVLSPVALALLLAAECVLCAGLALGTTAFGPQHPTSCVSEMQLSIIALSLLVIGGVLARLPKRSPS